MRPEARGIGYEHANVPGPLVCQPREAKPDPELPQQATTIPVARDELLAGDDIGRRAAQNGLGIMFLFLGVLMTVLLLCRFSDWPLRVLLWLRQFPTF